jgi:hypothetical protein
MSAPFLDRDRVPVARLLRPDITNCVPQWALIVQLCGWSLCVFILALLSLAIVPQVLHAEGPGEYFGTLELLLFGLFVLAVSVAAHMLIEALVKMLNHRPN